MAEPLISARINGGDEVRTRLKAFNSTERMVAWADRIGPIINKELRTEAPMGQDPHSGALKNSIKYERSTSIGRIQLRFHSDLPYARWVIEGTKDHPIDARNAQYMHFIGNDGKEYFRKHVHHPGTKANPFNERVYQRMLPGIAASFRALFERI